VPIRQKRRRVPGLPGRTDPLVGRHRGTHHQGRHRRGVAPQGWENGRLGYPTNNEYAAPGGVVARARVSRRTCMPDGAPSLCLWHQDYWGPSR
jgi:hypothetical protein